jgi:hypothetical protein
VTSPTNEGSDGTLVYWTRQGISVSDLRRDVQKAIDAAAAALASAQAAADALANMDVAHISGITPFGQSLLQAVDDVEARDLLNTGGGGTGGTANTNLALITDMSTLARQFNTDALTTPSQMRGIIGAGTGDSNVQIGQDSGAAASWDDLDALNTTVLGVQDQIGAINLTLASVLLDLAGTITASMLAATPIIYNWNGVSWPAREATTRPIWWIGGPASPPATGSTSGGGGLASIDLWLAKPLTV